MAIGKKNKVNVRMSTPTQGTTKRRKSDMPKINLDAQSTIPFKSLYEDGLIYVGVDKDGHDLYSICAELGNVDYSNRKDTDKEKLIDTYTRAFNSLPQSVHYQEVYMNVPYNTQRLYDIVEPKTAAADKEFYDAYAENQRGFVKQVVDYVSDVRLYLVLSYSVRSKLDLPRNILISALDTISGYYAEMGVTVTALDTVAYLNVLYNIYNPFDIDGLTLPKSMYERGLTFRHYIAPNSLRFNVQNGVRNGRGIDLGAVYSASYYVSGYADTLNEGFLQALMANNYRLIVSKHVDHIPNAGAIALHTKKLQTLEADNQDRQRRNKQQGTSYIPYDLQAKIDAERAWLDRLNGSEQMFEFGITLTVSAESLIDLQDITKAIQGVCSEFGVTIQLAKDIQEEAFNCCVPVGVNFLHNRTQDFPSSTVGFVIPFSYSRYVSAGGFYYGTNAHTHSPIIVSRKEDKNGNSFVLGKTGVGKSFFSKLEITDVMLQTKTDRVFVLDVEREFVGLCERLGGTVIRVAPNTNEFINPFDVVAEQEKEADAVRNKADLIQSIFTVFKDGKLTGQEKSIIDRCTYQVYKDYCASGYDSALTPTFKDYAAVLARQEEAEAKDLSLYLEMYVTGTANMFAHKTNVDLSNRFVVFDIQELNQNIKKVGMLILLDFIQNQLVRNFKLGYYTWIYADEFHMFYGENEDNNASGKFFERIFARCRKLGGLATGITQNATGVLRSESALGMLQNSQFVVLLEQATENLKKVSDLYDLSDAQAARLRSCKRGEGLIVTQNIAVPFSRRYPDNNAVYNTITTDFAEKIKFR